MDIMIDIETFNTDSDSSIATIGAIKFNRYGTIGPIEDEDTFYRRIDKQSCDSLGLSVSFETLLWWTKQSQSSQNEVFQLINRIPIQQALKELSEWIGPKPVHVWCQGLSFDIPILEYAYKKCKIPIPWKFWKCRDTRTVYDIKESHFHSPEDKHHALNDCYFQIQCLQAALTSNILTSSKK
jgi:hypothetical protein